MILLHRRCFYEFRKHRVHLQCAFWCAYKIDLQPSVSHHLSFHIKSRGIYICVTQKYAPVLQVLVQYVLSTYILLVYQSLTHRGLFPTVSLIHVSLSVGHTLLCGSLRLHLFPSSLYYSLSETSTCMGSLEQRRYLCEKLSCDASTQR